MVGGFTCFEHRREATSWPRTSSLWLGCLESDDPRKAWDNHQQGSAVRNLCAVREQPICTPSRWQLMKSLYGAMGSSAGAVEGSIRRRRTVLLCGFEGCYQKIFAI